VIVMLGYVLLIVPGIVFSMWYWFAGSVAVLERTTARGALARSRELGKGYYLRNLGIVSLTGLVVFLPIQVFSLLLGAASGLGYFPLPLAKAIGTVVGGLGGTVIQIAIVLIYYDLRVRKEAYDSAKLAEDLRR
jgi:hypothetical protein